tara:strand:- start:1064 stop:2011 length:948 start_codon:yes stop_codon:yes gene_type:complete
MSKCPFSVFHSNKNRLEEEKPSVIEDYTDDPYLRIRRIHPTQGSRIVKANSKLKGPDGQCETLEWPRKDALSRCGPYVHANQMGWWIFPGVDIDMTYHGDGAWDVNEYTKYDTEAEQKLYDDLPKYEYKTEDGKTGVFRSSPRAHVNAGLADKNIIQIWTGCIFRTPPGWCLLIRSPINACESYNRPYHIQEGVIESDWMDYDIWINVVVNRTHEKITLRQDMWPPIAQIIPVRREAYEANWAVDDRVISADDPEWASWQDYNFKKWERENEKDSKTYFKERSIQKPNKDVSKVLKIRDKYREERNNHRTKKNKK